MRPVRAKALIINAFAPTGRFAFINPYTQGGALGYVLLGLSARFVWLLTHPPEQATSQMINNKNTQANCSGYGGGALAPYRLPCFFLFDFLLFLL